MRESTDVAPQAGAPLPRPKRSLKRRVLRALLGLVGLVTLASVMLVGAAWTALGSGPDSARRARMEASPQHRDGKFHNPEPLWNDYWGMFRGMFGASAYRTPGTEIPVESVGPERFAQPPASGLRATWLGHSTVLLEIDGFRVLTDPVWGPRSSPLPWLGPERWYPPPLALEDMPELDAVVISHDHYDHLDYPTVTALLDLDVSWIVPLGVGAHLAYWGVPEARIVELDWGGVETLTSPTGSTLEVHATEARHASGRKLVDMDRTLWAGYAFIGGEHRAFFSGDTGLFKRLRDIGDRLGPFDLTMIEVGAYDRTWPDWHIGPEQAVEAHEWLKGEVFLPIHWGLFNLANHGWTEPMERTVLAAQAVGAVVASPRPGGSVEPARILEAVAARGVALERWWPDVPWETEKQHPIVSTQVDGRRD